MTLEAKIKQYLIEKYPYSVSEVEAILIAHDIAQIAEEGREVIAEGVLKISANYPYWDRYQIGEIIASDSWLRDKLRKHNSKPVKLTLEVQE